MLPVPHPNLIGTSPGVFTMTEGIREKDERERGKGIKREEKIGEKIKRREKNVERK